MIIGSIKEDLSLEKRVALTPEAAKNIMGLGIKICIEKNYADHIGIKDEEFVKAGVEIKNSSKEVLNSCNLLIKVNCISDEEIENLKDKTIIIGIFNPSQNKEKINKILKKNVNVFSLELLPRITRAQSMDVLSSQSNLAGYRAVIESIYEFEKAIPMMTAAGTVPAAKVLVIGAGVAGLQAVATAKRLGAIVSATDVRSASKEQVESLGGKFLTVDNTENMETTGGYAKETSQDYKKKQAEMMEEALKKNDIVICTALIPGKPAPRILTEKLVRLMKPGSIVYDLASEQGGNSAFSEPGKINLVDGIKVIGVKTLMNKLPLTASNLYSKNLFSFIRNLYSKEKKNFDINLEDEIISKTLIKEI